MHFSRKFSLFASFFSEAVRQFRDIVVLLMVVEEKLDVDVLAVGVPRHNIVVCNRSAAGVPAELYRGDSVVLRYIWNSNKLTKS